MENGTDSEDKNHIFRWVHNLTLAALTLLVISLFTPWWRVVVSYEEFGGLISEPYADQALFAPLWSPFMISTLGTKLSIHFQNVLVLLVGSIILICLSRAMIRRKPWLSPPLMWGAASFCGVGLLFFVIFFPAIALVGHVFWMWGSWKATFGLSDTYLTFYILPGFFLALGSLVLQIYLAARLTYGRVHDNLIPALDIPAALTRWGRALLLTRSLVIPISLLLVAPSIWGGLSYRPTISAAAYMNDWDFTHKSFEPGDQATVVGTVTNVTVVPTSYGDYTLLGLDGYEYLLAVEGDKSSRYPIGSWASIPVHFRAYSYNGIGFTWAEEGYAPLPMMFALTVVMSAVSYVMGAPILGDETDPNGTRLRILMPHDFPLDSFNLSMVKVEGYPYVGESGAIGSWHPRGMIDRMDPLRSGTSDNGTFIFSDVNDNGVLDWEDTIDLNLPPTEDDTHFETYMLGLYGPVDGIAYIIVRDQGPFLFYFIESEKARPYYFLTMPPDHVEGDRCHSRVELLKKIGPDVNATEYTVRLFEEDYRNPFVFPAETEGTNLGEEIWVRFQDAGAPGVLDIGDAWILENLTNGTFYKLSLRDEGMGGQNSIEWVCGVGANIASRPRVNLSAPTVDPNDPQRLLINITSVDWVLAGALHDYRAILFKNETPLLPPSGQPIRLVLDPDGWRDDVAFPLGPSDDGAGTWIAFNDTDGNGYLGPGDQFAVNNTAPQSRYELVLHYESRDRPIADISWNT
ncbi:MAG: hypothetical protein KAW84_04080 [Thermoplasmata archaeon]|nr:hypothetical protein [Thermoplasmata archaeon]